MVWQILFAVVVVAVIAVPLIIWTVKKNKKENYGQGKKINSK